MISFIYHWCRSLNCGILIFFHFVAFLKRQKKNRNELRILIWWMTYIHIFQWSFMSLLFYFILIFFFIFIWNKILMQQENRVQRHEAKCASKSNTIFIVISMKEALCGRWMMNVCTEDEEEKKKTSSNLWDPQGDLFRMHKTIWFCLNDQYCP